MSYKDKGKGPELLAPAGNYETFVAAINAGADAVYLGGQKFGARAFADNFTDEEVIRAITYAHLYGKKVYMTVNTLVKETEFGELYDYLKPYADSGLDGVIVQDFGVFDFIKRNFKNVELHASTQMAVSGVYSAKMLKKLGAVRVVPARELSLYEIKNIKEKADIEVEAFIHGAMCYSYSGMCLFSSIVGGRSGNRGRCAQSCRLPYKLSMDGDYNYPISLKDMCTISIIPKLIDAGIDSFKIEGRVKSAEYVAGVTSIYRKYIDMYLANKNADYKVAKSDMDILRHLYIRSEISKGYYEKHNGADMITYTSPAYNKTDEKVALAINQKYVTGEKKLQISAYLYMHIGEEMMLTLSNGDNYVTVTGGIVQMASKRPMSESDIASHICKMGDSFFTLNDIELQIDMDDNESGIFVPVKAINELRRRACDELLKELTRSKSA